MKYDRVFRRFLSITLVAVVISGLSLMAVMRTLSLGLAQRVERAREAVTEELDRLASVPPSPAAPVEQTATSFVGVRGGWLDARSRVAQLEALPPEWRAPLERTLAEAEASHARTVTATAIGPSTLVLAVELGPARFAWTGYLVHPSMFSHEWRWIAAGLAGGTLLLVVVSLHGAIAFRRDLGVLQATLTALGKDLTTPVPRPRLAELDSVAGGIARLAADLLASRDATEQLQRELAQNERLAALGRVAAGVAHEVRNPLAAIKLRLDLTAAGDGLPESAHQALETASQEIARLDRLVGDLLLVAGKKMGPRQATDLGALVRSRAEALGTWAATQRVALHVEGEGFVTADPESVARALDNMLRNAVEAAPPDTTVEARVVATAGAIEVRVRDQGRGVEPRRRSELFEPFFTTKAEGTGLGLAISRAIARAHGGELTYTRTGDVTCFALSLPRDRDVA